MLALLFAFGYAFLIFGLSAEADSNWLRVLGFVAASYMALAGALAGWRYFREE